MISRRTFVAAATLTPALPLLIRVAWSADAADAADARVALQTSKLIYLTTIQSNGEESRCKAEIWFAYHGGDCFVVTPPDAWRAEAVGRGLTRARFWVGEFGIWTDADSAFRQAPERMATASLETDGNVQALVLDAMGEKYVDDGWTRWGREFREGLVDGSRVMIRYAIDA